MKFYLGMDDEPVYGSGLAVNRRARQDSLQKCLPASATLQFESVAQQ